MKTNEQTPHGEQALVEQIATLQKQLDDCLETEPKWIKDNPFKEVIYNTIAAQFLPVEKFHHKESFYEGPRELWFLFRSAILEGPACANLLQAQAFRDVLWCMNNFIDDLSSTSATFDLFNSSAKVIIENSRAEGWALLLEAIDLSKGHGVYADESDIQWLRLMILNIHRCVKMYHEATEPEGKTT